MRKRYIVILFGFIFVQSCSNDYRDTLRRDKEKRLDFLFYPEGSFVHDDYWSDVKWILMEEDIPTFLSIMSNTYASNHNRSLAIHFLLMFEQVDVYHQIFEFAENANYEDQALFFSALTIFVDDELNYLSTDDRSELKNLFIEFLEDDRSPKFIHSRYFLFLSFFDDDQITKMFKDVVTNKSASKDRDQILEWFERMESQETANKR